jgi:hypothetical protein
MISRPEGRIQIQRICEQGAEKNIWKKKEEVIGGLRTLHNEELHNL